MLRDYAELIEYLTSVSPGKRFLDNNSHFRNERNYSTKWEWKPNFQDENTIYISLFAYFILM